MAPVSCNLPLEIENQKHEQYRDTKGIGLERVKQIVEILSRKEDKTSIRDLCIVRLLFDMGLRRNEVCSIDVEDIIWNDSSLLILGKGQVEKQKLSMPATTMRAIQKWLTVRGVQGGPLFCPLDRANRKSIKRLTGTGLYKIMKRYGSTVHGLRHTAITECCKVIAEQNLGIESLIKFSRHKNLNTALIYLDHLENKQSQLSTLVANQIKK